MSKLNHMICPNCGHDFYTESAYATCDGCQTMFYAAQSLTVTSNRARSQYDGILSGRKP